MPTKIRKDDGTYVDADDVAVEGAAVANAAALTATAPASATATNPSAPAAYAAVVNMTEPVAKAEGEAVSAALATLRGEVATYETAISALVVDCADLRTKLAAAVVDLGTLRTAHQNLLGELELSGALTAN